MRRVRMIGVMVLLAPALAVFGSARAQASGPREGHFAAPDASAFEAQFDASAAGSEPGFYQTSEYMMGRVAVGVILPESDGGIDANQTDWTPQQRQQVLDEVRAGLEWWARQSPSANLTFIIDDHASQPIATGYEPIAHPQYEEGFWIGDVLSNLGYSSGSFWTRVRSYVNALRSQHRTDWAFAIFVVNSAGDPDAAFADGYFAYAYLGGPFLVMTYDNAGYGIGSLDAVTAHEVGHIFRALDQYPAANMTCGARSGYLGVENQNSQQPGCASDALSIMRGGTYPYLMNAVDPYARGQVGWRDSDGDGLYDPLDTTPVLTIDAATRSGDSWSYTGRASDQPFLSPLRPSATINDIAVEYSVDGSAWKSTVPGDGHFDSADEAFRLTLSLSSSGNHRVQLRAHNSAGNVSDATGYVIVVPDPVDGGLDTWLEPPVSGLPGGTAQSIRGVASSFNADGTPGVPLSRVEYRVDGGAWQVAHSEDGAFDSAEEGFAMALDLPGGHHRVEARAIDATGRAEQNLAGIQLTVGFSAFIPVVQR